MNRTNAHVTSAKNHSPTSYTVCPGCGAPVANLQVVSTCTQCEWMGLL